MTLLIGNAFSAEIDFSKSVPGSLSLDIWSPVVSKDVRDLYFSERFRSAPTLRKLVKTTSFREIQSKNGVRLRGYLKAPVTGSYRFWLSARNGAEFWLSSDKSKYQKRSLIRLGLEEGSGSGVSVKNPKRWDSFACQVSEEVQLVKGETYFFEAYNQALDNNHLHLSLAWAVPGKQREPLPLSVVRSYGEEPTDADDDYLPDAWEKQHGLTGSGEYDDPDLDGLVNREEFVNGTNPTKADSDGDGLTDAEEIRAYHTDPGHANTLNEVRLGELPLDEFKGNGFLWNLSSEGELVPESFRGLVSWDFEAADVGYHCLNVSLKLLGDLYLREEVEVDVTIDTRLQGRKKVVFSKSGETLLRVVTPYLSDGLHTVTLGIKNKFSRRRVSIQKIEMLRPSDQQAPWLKNVLEGRNFLKPVPKVSAVSPICLEGGCLVFARVNGQQVDRGSHLGHWYKDLVLSEKGSTEYEINFEPGIVRNGTITWSKTNVFDEGVLRVRLDDALKLSAVPRSEGPVILTVPSIVNWALEPGAVARQSSDEGGFKAAKAVDDGWVRSREGRSFSQTAEDADEAWWEVDLGQSRWISRVRIWNVDFQRHRLTDFRISVLAENGKVLDSRDFHTNGTFANEQEYWDLSDLVFGRRVMIERLGPDRDGKTVLSLTEVEVMGSVDLKVVDGEFVVHRFGEAGTFVIRARTSAGEHGKLTVKVGQADFQGGTRDMLAGSVEPMSLPNNRFFDELHLDAGPGTMIEPKSHKGRVLSYRAVLDAVGERKLLARLFKGGPIMGEKPLNLIDVMDGRQLNFSSGYQSQSFPGFQIQSAPFVVESLPRKGKVVVEVKEEGVSFIDGQLEREISEIEFANGISYLQLLCPPDWKKRVKLEFRIFGRNGGLVGAK